jgi:GNAT superfamily N-acetyltransferase
MTNLVTASGPVLDEIFDTTHAIWSEGLSRRDYESWQRAQMSSAWGERNLRRVALVDGSDVLASAKRYDFIADVDGVRTSVIGIGAVFTPPARRGRGHARTLIDAMTADAEARGCRLALLFSEIGPAYYASMGFRVVPLEEVAFEVPVGASRGEDVRRGRPGDLAAMIALNARTRTTSTLALERTADLVDFGLTRRGRLSHLSKPGLLTVEWLVVDRAGSVDAYVIATRRPRGIVIEDCGDVDPHGTNVADLIARLAAEPSTQPSMVHAWLPTAYRDWTRPALWHAVADEMMMVKPIGGAPPPKIDGPVTYWNLDVF